MGLLEYSFRGFQQDYPLLQESEWRARLSDTAIAAIPLENELQRLFERYSQTQPHTRLAEDLKAVEAMQAMLKEHQVGGERERERER